MQASSLARIENFTQQLGVMFETNTAEFLLSGLCCQYKTLKLTSCYHGEQAFAKC